VTRHAFHFDAAACSGCKACQIACRDRNALPAGVLWRRVYEVAGGGWTRQGDAWVNDVVAYNVSMACNHCERAICVEVCPTGAMAVHANGAVLIDVTRCIGCRYCEWACPYAAPQYDTAAGLMTKCTACSDDVAAGIQPACVTACPLRVLDFGSAAELAAQYGATANMHPLPDPALTQPSLLLKPHPSAPRPAVAQATTSSTGAGSVFGLPEAAGLPSAVSLPGAAGLPRVMNREEVVGPAALRRMREPSLVAFTLLAQAAVGLFWATLGVRLIAGSRAQPLLAAPFLAVGALLLVAVLASLLHLGARRNARYAMANVRQSWLSREILAALLFGGGWSALLVLHVTGLTSPAAIVAAGAFTGLAGGGLLYSMAQVYRLRTVPAWDSPLTTVSFLVAAGGLGTLSCALLLGITVEMAVRERAPFMAETVAAGMPLAATIASSMRLLLFGAATCIVVDVLLAPAWRGRRRAAARASDPGLRPPASQVMPPSTTRRLQALSLAAIVVAYTASAAPGSAVAVPWLSTVAGGLALFCVAAAAGIARTHFYASHGRHGL
jgi:anaerobic dimethyl sulfoxide reductase subunit B